MVPRPEVVALAIDMPPGGVPEGGGRLAVHALSRLPRVARRHRRRPPRPRPVQRDARPVGSRHVDLESLLRPAYVVPERRISRSLLQEFRRTNTHFAVVVDEYGGDGRGSSRSRTCSRRSSARSRTSSTCRGAGRAGRRGHVSASTACSRSTTSTSASARDLPDEDYHTVGGFVFGELGHAPHEGDTVEHDGLRFTVLEVEGNRIERLEVEFQAKVATQPAAATGRDRRPTRPREGRGDRAARRGRVAGGRDAALRSGRRDRS